MLTFTLTTFSEVKDWGMPVYPMNYMELACKIWQRFALQNQLIAVIVMVSSKPITLPACTNCCMPLLHVALISFS